MRNKRWNAVVLALAVWIGALALAACQPVMSVSDTMDTPAATEEAAQEQATPEDSAAPGMAGLAIANSEELGDFVADGAGMTLYMFLKDEPGVSNCYDQCAERWPPLLLDGDATLGEGVDAALVGATERTDGTMQLTYAGWPLYYWFEDMAPGDTLGQTVGDVWFVVSPAGDIIGYTPADLAVGSSDDLGEFLVDGAGMTLYMFLNDEPGVSNCYDQCAEHWPPLLVEGDATLGEGVDAALVGTTERTDGAVQLTYAGWPLYYWFEDMAPGDTLGQTVGDVWFVITPAGEIVQ